MLHCEKISTHILRHYHKYVIFWSFALIFDLFILLYMIIYFLENLFDNASIKSSSILILFIHIIILCILIAVAIYNKDVLNGKRVALQNKMLLEQIDKNQCYQLQVREKAILLQKEEIEFKKHISNIDALMKNGRTTEIADYISLLNRNEFVDKINIFTGKAMLDIMFSEKQQKAIEYDICLKIDYQLNARIHHLSEYDMSILFSNLLDNALESAAQSKEKVVLCEVSKKTEYMDLIIVQNSCDEEPMIRKNMPISRENNESHGYGTKIVQRKVQLYKGNLFYEYDKQNKIFSAYILIPVQDANIV